MAQKERTIREVRDRRTALEAEIRQLLYEFTRDYGVLVDEVHVTPIGIDGGGADYVVEANTVLPRF